MLLIFSIASLFTGTYSAISSFITSYGYIAIFILGLLESVSLPIPSEVVLPAIGVFAAEGLLNLYISIIVALAGSMVGIAIDYFIAYYLGKDVVYKHLHLFHIKRSSIESFDRWFIENGSFAVFIARLLPVLRGLISFPAGFAMMPKKKFFFYSFLGTVIWEVALVLFGYYALQTKNLYLTISLVAVFIVVLYVIYAIAMRKINRKK